MVFTVVLSTKAGICLANNLFHLANLKVNARIFRISAIDYFSMTDNKRIMF